MNTTTRIDTHQIVNAILSTLILACLGLVWSSNNQIIVINEKLQTITKSLEDGRQKENQNEARLRALELTIIRK